ncbi:hypothetical protein CYMTET_14327 [Cymbomonas tetramitiformis]|uniref:Uncharacterized protein n=1 Tax=Cymbomonas tetramitiformis TaxID=36881 RepID=A0AAE0LA07_9CHLO|nr:hypothetical protein CYMTET_14327 [Cymbomonas tetramitiformis]
MRHRLGFAARRPGGALCQSSTLQLEVSRSRDVPGKAPVGKASHVAQLVGQFEEAASPAPAEQHLRPRAASTSDMDPEQDATEWMSVSDGAPLGLEDVSRTDDAYGDAPSVANSAVAAEDLLQPTRESGPMGASASRPGGASPLTCANVESVALRAEVAETAEAGREQMEELLQKEMEARERLELLLYEERARAEEEHSNCLRLEEMLAALTGTGDDDADPGDTGSTDYLIMIYRRMREAEQAREEAQHQKSKVVAQCGAERAARCMAEGVLQSLKALLAQSQLKEPAIFSPGRDQSPAAQILCQMSAMLGQLQIVGNSSLEDTAA